MMFEAKRLHPISALMNFIKGLKDAVLPIIIVIFFNTNNSSGSMDWIPYVITGAFLFIVLIAGIIKWIRFTYRIEESELRIEYGLVFRKKRYIPLERIQSLNFSEGVLHRPFQLVKVSVETAGSSDLQKAEAELTAIKRIDANELETLISNHKATKSEDSEEGNIIEPEAEQKRHKVYEMKLKDIIIMAITSGGAGVVLSGVGVFFTQFMDALPIGAIYTEVVDWIQFSVLIIVVTALIMLLIAYGISILLTIFRYANFSVFINENDLIITRGWLEKKQMTIPLNRIQGIRIDENLIRQPLGYASVAIISAGGSLQKGEEHQTRLLPFIKRENIPYVLKSILNEYELNTSLHQPPKRSKLRYMIRHSWFLWFACIPVSIFFYPYGLLSIAAAIVFTLIGLLAYKDAGWHISDKQLTLRSRSIIKQTFLMKKHRVQATASTQTIFQKRAGLSSIQITLKSGIGGTTARCYYINDKEAGFIMNWFRITV